MIGLDLSAAHMGELRIRTSCGSPTRRVSHPAGGEPAGSIDFTRTGTARVDRGARAVVLTARVNTCRRGASDPRLSLEGALALLAIPARMQVTPHRRRTGWDYGGTWARLLTVVDRRMPFASGMERARVGRLPTLA